MSTAPPDPVLLYSADPPDGICAVPLDGLNALYHRRSGTTHIVEAAVLAILDILVREPLSASALLAEMVRLHGLQTDGDSEAALAARLIELECAGLVFRA